MNDIPQNFLRVNFDKDIDAKESITSITDGSWLAQEVDLMGAVEIIYPELETKEDIKIDCEKIQEKIPQIKEIYYKKTLDVIKLFVFFDEIDFETRSKIFDEIVKLRGKYNNYFDFKAFTMDFDRNVIEKGMEKLV